MSKMDIIIIAIIAIGFAALLLEAWLGDWVR